MRISSRLISAALAGTLALTPLAIAAQPAAAKAKGKGHKATKGKGSKGKSKSKGKVVTLNGGTMTLTLTSAVASSLESAKVVLAAVSPATGSGTSVVMPVTGGKLNTSSGDGTVVSSGGAPSGNGFTLTQTTQSTSIGGFEFGGGEEQFSLTAPITVTIGGAAKYGAGTGTNLTANVNGTTTPSGPFFTLKLGKPGASGSTVKISGAADLTSPAAEVLDSFSGVKFTAGEEFATIAVNATG